MGGVSLFTSFNGLCKQALNTVLSSGIRAEVFSFCFFEEKRCAFLFLFWSVLFLFYFNFNFYFLKLVVWT